MSFKGVWNWVRGSASKAGNKSKQALDDVRGETLTRAINEHLEVYGQTLFGIHHDVVELQERVRKLEMSLAALGAAGEPPNTGDGSWWRYAALFFAAIAGGLAVYVWTLA